MRSILNQDTKGQKDIIFQVGSSIIRGDGHLFVLKIQKTCRLEPPPHEEQ
jgi:hypothetical protein